MKIEWDLTKAASNLNKHGVAFEDAMRVFYDVERIETYDGRKTRDDDTIGLISARKANAREQKQYRQANA